MRTSSEPASEPAATTAGPPPGPTAPQPIQALRFLRDPMRFMRDCERRYGPVFTVRMLGTPGYVFVSSPDLAHRIFGTDRDIGRAGAARGEFLEELTGANSLLTLDGDAWMRQRRMLGSAFHGKRIERYRDQMAEVAARHVRQWPLDRPFALRPRFQAITLEVILRVVFGVTDTERVSQLMRLLPRLLDSATAVASLRFLVPPRAWDRLDALLTRTPRTANARFVALRDRTDALLYDEIAQRRTAEDADQRTDILSVLLAARDSDGHALTDTELRDSLVTLLVAGHETTATALSWCFERLTRNPNVHERTRVAVREGDADYLDALAKETLRTRPVVSDMPRILDEETTLGGYRIPAGWWVTAAPLLQHTSPELFAGPEEFRPERFLTDDIDPHAWIPFGGGRRQCLGAQFALLEMRAVIPEVVSRVRLRVAGDPGPERMDARNVTLSPDRGARVIAAPEDAPHG